ncbi:MAG: amino acid permease, partial [Ruminococcus sp.]|nr:amino acid permease [Ruminococcus sp.]
MKNTDKSSAGRKTLSSLDVWAIAFGCMIGWGAFVMPGTTFLPIAGPAGTIISMCVGTLLMIVIG